MRLAIELELLEEVPQRPYRHVGRRRSMRRDELFRLQRLQFGRGCAGGSGGAHHLGGAIERPAMIEAELRDHEQRLAIADANSTGLKRHALPSLPARAV